MKIAYFDCFSGISGDMILGALVDSGVPLSLLENELKKLKIGRISLKAKKVRRGHLAATKIEIDACRKQVFSCPQQFLDKIEQSTLSENVKTVSKKVVLCLAKAEAKIHKQPLHAVHFHQLGELDTIVDIVAGVAAVQFLGIKEIYSSRLTLGTGMVNFKGESFPLPAPAVLELLKRRTVFINPEIKHEVVTPTGAALLCTLSREITEPRPWSVIKIGYGAGTYEAGVLPNVLRIVIAEAETVCADDTVVVAETNIDDMNALHYEMLFERLFAAGALDVYTVAIMMKKMRPAAMVHVQVREDDLEKITAVLFEETTTLGIRLQRITRRKLERKVLNMKSDYGIIVRVKIASMGGKVVTVAPEYEDCKKIARQKNLPFKTVYDLVKAQAIRKFG
ncbi:MAG: nickel pincer cofactor biosynthesis protein LarC [Candidatus Omnitrophica bacterium]|nr:nickel pincer cofactor biosynthesis protein LarC [Candidatus Omnitrophota bacterium]MBU4477737.1 nickel pincer cofactor biosynthesis protein LarC [Candidatus Omnitrophota bacterium]MCG2703029.1 nickel pincer cofactor biosynthesis protein LarC [Candidatus Omnitrophota bacterium]